MKKTNKIHWWMTAFLLLIVVIGSGCSGKGEQYLEKDFFAMDTYMSVKIQDEENSTICEDIEAEILRIEGMLSVTDSNSEVSRLNTANGEKYTTTQEMADLITRCLTYSGKTDGVFNIALYPIIRAWGFTTGEYQVPSQSTIDSLLPLTDWTNIHVDGNSITMREGMELDFGAVGKGYATDACAMILKNRGISSALLRLGGNIYAIGKKEDGSAWKIGIGKPFSEDYVGVLEAHDEAVITSGDYQRYFEEDGVLYHHIMDSSTGKPVQNNLNSVTIISSSGTTADVLSTTYFALGLEASVEEWRNSEGIEVIWITEDGMIYITEGIQERFTIEKGLESTVIFR